MAIDWEALPEDVKNKLSMRQRDYVDAAAKCKNMKALADALGIDVRNAHYLRDRTVRALSKMGYTEHFNATRFVDPGQEIIGKSTFTKDEEGNNVWIKTKAQKEKDQAFKDAIQELCGGIKPFKKVKAPAKSDSSLLVEYGITDYHLGQYSWAEEAGADWDIEIAEQVFFNAFSDMMDGSPDGEQAIFAQLGDFLDFDGQTPVTPTAKNVLDVDTRYPLLVRLAISCCVKAVEMLLHKHKRVHVICAEGNHDISGSVWLTQVMLVAFKDNPRVTVETSAFPYYAFTWGKCFLGYHHGHLTKMEQLADKFYSEAHFRKMMALADYIYLRTGHLHTQHLLEKSGAIVERWPTLNARNAYGAKYQASQRAAHATTFDKELGQVSRKTVQPRAA